MKRTSVVKILIFELILFAFFCGRLTVMVSDQKNAVPVAAKVYASSEDTDEASDVAKHYLATGAYSEEGLITALQTYEHFTEGAARTAVGSLNVDWQEQAIKEADAYLHMDGTSERRLREYLSRDLFTEEQIDKAIASLDPDWQAQAKRRAEALKSAGVNDINIKASLLSQGFLERDISATD